MNKITLFLVVLLGTFSAKAQEINSNRKTLNATRIKKAPKIDGVLDDDAWKNTPIAKDFTMMRPTNGEKEPSTHKTEVKLVYDNNAIYISAMMYDPNPTKIPREITNRDNFGNSDFFMAMINPIDDGQNPNMFIVTAAGVQIDAKVSNGNNEDYNWSAVWESDISFTDNGWIAEIKIPYRALRFANDKVQSWGMNFHREAKILNARYTWNHIDNKKGSWTQYDGLVKNFKNIKPPTRLSFYPYASVISDTNDGHTIVDWSVGMDIKYGLTENFTLDATLIPDFSQVGFDDVVLNLGPFEQRFTEQRQFFTEGTELFNKGRLFYSRRVGGAPIDQFDVSSQLINEDTFDTNGQKVNEEITDSPGKVTMLNAIKVSGRTKKGLGIGIFNAITQKTEATITTTTSQNNGGVITENVTTRKAVTNPFSNYNILVLDQQFNQNSTVSLINTNVTRDGRFRDANVTALDWHIETKDSKFNADGSVKMSNISDDINNPNTGYTFDNSFGYNSGNWRGEIGYNFENKDFNPNDLGILFSNNQQAIYSNGGWRTLQPTKNFNRYSFNFYNSVNFQHFSGIYTGYEAGLNFNAQTKKRFSFGGNLNYGTESKDFFEPRQGSTSGIYFLQPERKNINGWISTNSQKKLELNANAYYTNYSNNPKSGYGFSIAPRYRFTNQFSLRYRLNFNKTNNDQGYVDEYTEENIASGEDVNYVVFGMRDRKNYTNTISGKYNFSTNSSLSLSFRHYWGSVNYNEYYNLNTEGGLDSNATYTGDNVNFNSWNLDLNYIWQFAPGSQLIAFYRNSIFNEDTNADLNFFKNLDNLFDQSQQHTFSVRFVYFIDYNKLKKIF